MQHLAPLYAILFVHDILHYFVTKNIIVRKLEKNAFVKLVKNIASQ